MTIKHFPDCKVREHIIRVGRSRSNNVDQFGRKSGIGRLAPKKVNLMFLINSGESAKMEFSFNFMKIANELILLFSSPLTLFAPTNEAFDNIPREVFNQLDADRDLLKNVLLGHVVPKTTIFYRDGNLRNDQVYESAALDGTLLRVNVYLKNKFYDVSR